MMQNPENFITHFSSIDGTCVDYFKNSELFEIFFDGALYQPPKALIESEKKRIAEKQARLKELKR